MTTLVSVVLVVAVVLGLTEWQYRRMARRRQRDQDLADHAAANARALRSMLAEDTAKFRARSIANQQRGIDQSYGGNRPWKD